MKTPPEPRLSPSHIVTGRRGEQIAAEYLLSKGWKITEKNWRSGRGEIDLIAWEPGGILVFLEVKTRSSELFGGPEGAVDISKSALLLKTAGLYMESIGYEWEIRIDVIALLLRRGRLLELRHYEDVFF